jgi:hypothetical protein
MAYVTSINASARRLLASGATAFPTHYLIGDGAPPMSTGPMPAVMEERATDAMLKEVMDAPPPPAGPRSIRVQRRQNGANSFCWTRPDVVRVLRVGTVGTALVETRNEFESPARLFRHERGWRGLSGAAHRVVALPGSKFFFSRLMTRGANAPYASGCATFRDS